MTQAVTKLVDGFDRTIHYLRLSVTDRCNLRCTYCMAEEMEFLPKHAVLSLEEMIRLSRCFVQLGVDKIRLTGGEPLVRRGIDELAQELGALPGLRELVMTTNGVLLDQHTKALRAAGVRRLNISIDSLKPERFKQMTRIGDLADVLRGIEAAQEAGFERIKLNSVILAGQNDDEILDLVDFAHQRGFDISFIEEMPLGEIDSHGRASTQYSSADIRTQLENRFGLLPSTETSGGPARYYQIANSNTHLGFISPISHNFCASCNRVRLTTEGRLLLCLGNEHSVDLRQIMRDGGSDHDLQQAIVDSMAIKPEKHFFDPQETRILRFMNATGG